MFEAINSWFENGCDYAGGVALYTQYGSNGFLKIMLGRGETAINRQKLNTELLALRNQAPQTAGCSTAENSGASSPPCSTVKKCDTDPQDPIAKKSDAGSNTCGIAKKSGTVQGESPELLRIIQQREASYAEIRALHPLLHSEPEGEGLRQIAERIAKLGKKNAELWQRYNYLLEHTGEPDQVAAPLPPVMIDLNLVNERELIRKSLNKAENRIKGQAKPKQRTLDLIAKQKQALKDIDAKITAIKKGGEQ